MLLPLVPEYFSPKVLDFLSGMGFTMLSFDFLKLNHIPFIAYITEWESYSQPDEYLHSLGMISVSSILNHLSIIGFLILIGIIHFCVLLTSKCTQNSKHMKCKSLISRLFRYFTFNIYIRIFMQSIIFTALCIFSEIYTLNLDTIAKKISFGLCVILTLLTATFYILSFYMYKKSFQQQNEVEPSMCEEFFNGIKMKKYSKLYAILFLSLRLSLCSVVIFGKSMNTSRKSTLFYLLNISYWIFLFLIRPCAKLQDNILEVINQLLFCSLSVPLTWLNTENSWTTFYEGFYTSVLMASPIIGCLVCLIFMGKEILSYFLSKRTKKPPSVIPKPPSFPQNHQEESKIGPPSYPSFPRPSPSINNSHSVATQNRIKPPAAHRTNERISKLRRDRLFDHAN
ncbi:unnamed protein product [Moneuplotes crassus]|uniref:Uncharacterized protein n=1 Tax=Euplotes crassus TaxID=5936 RepID=A0AAD1XGZ8_EUPCR|nr:unnamed protein product [Moneuplotes crassus]